MTYRVISMAAMSIVIITAGGGMGQAQRTGSSSRILASSSVPRTSWGHLTCMGRGPIRR
jgi:hypothetical protein